MQPPNDSPKCPHNGRKLAALIFLLASLTAEAGGFCQSPAGQPFGVYATGGLQQPVGLTYNPDGGVTISWIEGPSFLDQPGPATQWAQEFLYNDSPIDIPFLLLRNRHPVPNLPFGGLIAANATGQLVVAFSSWRPNANRYWFEEGPKNLKLNTAEKFFFRYVTGVAIDTRGDFVVVWSSQSQEEPDRANYDSGVYARLVDWRGVPVGSEIHVNTVRRGNQSNPRVAMAAETGAFVVVWDTNDSGKGVQAAGQLFSPAGAKVGGEFRIGSVDAGVFSPGQQIAMAPDGSFVVVWNATDRENGGDVAIFGQRFTAQGTPVGPVLQIGKGDLPRGQAVACDPHGNLVVIWIDGTGKTMARLFHADGTLSGSPVGLTRDFSEEYTMVAFGPSGTFTVAGSDSHVGAGFAVVRRFSASPGEEICVFQSASPLHRTDAMIRCDTGRTGNAHVRHALLGSQPGDIGLLGDVDGDGRADPCLFRNGVFLCDTDHDYNMTDTVVAFGLVGDVPLLADIDGDGRADPCVSRGGRFLCDTDHAGGAPEVEIAFGAPGDVPLLGDIDGDGRVDPCVFRAGTFLCDTNHDGVAEVEIKFGAAGDRVLLGDFDGDGRADPCIVTSIAIRCDTAHNGGEPEGLVLDFVDRESAPLMGNLDGF